MQPTRRKMMLTITGAIAALIAPRAFSAGQPAGQKAPTPQPLQSPNAPANQNVPAGLDGAEIPVRDGARPIPAATWMEIQSDAQKLLVMATDFKTQVDHTNLSSTLPVTLLQDAHRIEKMAKQIQDRMKR